MTKYVRVLYGLRIGQVAKIVKKRRDIQHVYRSGLFFGPPGYAGGVPGPWELTLEFPDGERATYREDEVEAVVRVEETE